MQNINSLLDSHEFTRFLFDNISSAVLIVDRNFKVKKINNTYSTLFSKAESDIINQLCGNSLGCAFAVEEGVQCGNSSKCSECNLRSCLVQNKKLLEDSQTIYITRKFYIKDTPVLKHLRLKIKGINYNNEEVFIITIDDISDLEEQKEKIKEMANLDYLTKLYNRRYFFDVAGKIYENAKREINNVALAIVDIDHFKKINDTYGHDAGDFVLSSFADILKTKLRKADVICRYGGEEFCILMVTKSKDDAFGVIDTLRQIVEKKVFIFNEHEISFTFSGGICQSLENSLDEMIKKADEKLYEAKESGRNQIII
jgi:diguanylate cyclase (GGDEF)-like protein